MEKTINKEDMRDFVKRVESSMLLERMSISELLKSLEVMEPVFRDFDHKVVNKRLETALKDQTEGTVYLDRTSYGHYVRVHSHHSAKIGNSWAYPSYHRDTSFKLVFNELETKRLDAEKTIKNLNDVIENLHKSFNSYEFSDTATEEKYLRLKRIEREIDELMDDCDTITRNQLRARTYKLR